MTTTIILTEHDAAGRITEQRVITMAALKNRLPEYLCAAIEAGQEVAFITHKVRVDYRRVDEMPARFWVPEAD